MLPWFGIERDQRKGFVTLCLGNIKWVESATIWFWNGNPFIKEAIQTFKANFDTARRHIGHCCDALQSLACYSEQVSRVCRLEDELLVHYKRGPCAFEVPENEFLGRKKNVLFHRKIWKCELWDIKVVERDVICPWVKKYKGLGDVLIPLSWPPKRYTRPPTLDNEAEWRRVGFRSEGAVTKSM